MRRLLLSLLFVGWFSLVSLLFLGLFLFLTTAAHAQVSGPGANVIAVPSACANCAETDTANTFEAIQTFEDQIRAADGTAAAPGYSFTSDTDTGLFLASGALRFVIGGALVTAISAARGIDIRSDSAPFVMGASSDVWLHRDAAAIFAQRNGTNAQTLRVYGTFTDASNLVNAEIGATATLVTIGARTLGSGADDVSINLDPAGTGTIQIDGTVGVSGTCTAVTVTKGIVTTCTL